jgi:23S rRNA pseudouridine1911/1915/1917 synthase
VHEKSRHEARSLNVDDGLAGSRLDHALAQVLPELGLRGRKRFIENGWVRVDGRPAAAALRLRAGQVIEILPDSEPVGTPELPVVARCAGYAALFKPAGLHSAALAGGGGPSAESLLPALFPEARPRLLNRLDLLTSGLLLAALDDAAAASYAALAPLAVLKEYLAVVAGVLAEPLELKRRLDTEDRRRTRVLGKLEPDSRLWTLVWPEAALAGERTLVRVRIHSGARHQIRAHLAAAGLPILGDPLYGEGEGGGLFLHHGRLEFPGFSARCAPSWLDGLERLTPPEGQ